MTILQIDSVSSIKNILETVCAITGMGLGVVAHVTERQWIACSVRDTIGIGLRVGQPLDIHSTICSEIFNQHEPIIISDIDLCSNSRWKEKLSRKGFKSYISFPVFDSDGTFVGTLCALDFKTTEIEQEKIIPLFKTLSELITFHLGTLDKLKRTEELLLEERRYSKRRDTLLSVLAHDLNNPLSAIISLSQFLHNKTEDSREKRTTAIIYDAGLRMKGLIGNILDFARGKLGGGINLQKSPQILEPLIVDILKEVHAADPERDIVIDIQLDQPVICDSGRMAQVFSNLIANAFRHSNNSSSIYINSSIQSDRFIFKIENNGQSIPLYILKNLFKPFVRTKNNEGEGLGLGLYISKEIIIAHGGEVDVQCQDGKVTFTAWIPV
ncbi:hypothetical protein KO02_09270 [Sphingobacterium sp. ML3W]|uniref:sensor histidine kinase n=1 Tax=Sphingobacterium sp. ML3W TaxID=1538644 RepID=UPI0004F595B0|nr:GAF domain-containing sensor histidine kinase [Sphingobacterium sp. ML3W]AIM36865.1 hypothetical protein KO02_09270 [Sphingobacterium sp. ML3W]